MILTPVSDGVSLLKAYGNIINAIKNTTTSIWSSIRGVFSSSAKIKSNLSPHKPDPYKNVINELKSSFNSGNPLLNSRRVESENLIVNAENNQGGLAVRAALCESIGIWRPYTGGMMNVCDDDNARIRYNGRLIHRERYEPPKQEYCQQVFRDMINSVNRTETVWPSLLQNSPYKRPVNASADPDAARPRVVSEQLKAGSLGVHYYSPQIGNYSDW